MKRKTIVLVLTQKCNLKCSYCYEESKSKTDMSFETAKSIIDKQLIDCQSQGYDEIIFELFGGEPFCNFELIKSLTKYIKGLCLSIPFLVFITTNGTLVHGEIKEWLKANKDCVWVSLSYDGTPYMQDINRSNSAKLIDLSFFKDNYPGQQIKMTVSQETLPFLADGVIFLHQQGHEVACNLAYGIDWSNPSNKNILSNELQKLISFYLTNPEVIPCEMLSRSVMNVYCEKDIFNKSCGAGIEDITFDVDGKQYPCQLFTPMSCGEEKATESANIHFYSSAIPKEVYDPKCYDCIIKGACMTCYGSNYINSGNIYYHDENYCELSKVIVKARAYFQACLWANKRLNLSEQEEIALLQSIQFIEKNLKI